MTITAAQPGWTAVFWFRYEDREEYTVETVIGWWLKHNDEIEPVSMVPTGQCTLPTPAAAGQPRRRDALASRYLGCLEDDAPWPFDCKDPRTVTPNERGVRSISVAREPGAGTDMFELEE